MHGGRRGLRDSARQTLAEIEKTAIVQTLRRTNWNKRKAADVLGLYRPTLYSKMKKYGIADEGVRALPAAISLELRRPRPR